MHTPSSGRLTRGEIIFPAMLFVYDADVTRSRSHFSSDLRELGSQARAGDIFDKRLSLHRGQISPTNRYPADMI